MESSREASASQVTESLVKRLAGPSTGKAGLAKDQTEINRIIAEASKGSKFYENEKRKDRDLTERISRILKLRNESIKGVDLSKVEQSIDHLIIELEGERDLSQFIVHFDMDAFFANVELLHNPALKGKPFAVGGGVLSTASYEARKYGVRSGMPSFIAKKLCPELVLLKSHYEWYNSESEKVFSILKRYDPHLCAAGCDEGYLNITPYVKEHNLPVDECVEEIRRTVCAETKLTVSAGIAPNKMLAKICSDKNKPNGQFHLPFDSKAIIDFMRDLSIRKVPGIGRVNERLLESVGIKTCGDIYTHRAMLSLMDKQFGLRFLLRTYLGIGSNIVRPYQREERRSIGAERTFSPIASREIIFQKLDEVAAELEKDMETNGWIGQTVTLKFKLDTYQVFTRAKSLGRWISKKEDLFTVGKELLTPELPLSIRLIGLRVTKLKDLKVSTTSSGIKRFFGPVQSVSTIKERKSTNGDDESEGFLEINDEEVMPGFHEQDEADLDSTQPDHDNGEDIGPTQTLSLRRPPNSMPGSSVTSPPALPSSKPRSVGPSSIRRSPGDVSTLHPSTGTVTPISQTISRETHECPICNEVLVIDNDGLNAHIDYCLSRDAIRQAQSQGSTARSRESFAQNSTKDYAVNGLKRLKLRPGSPVKGKRNPR